MKFLALMPLLLSPASGTYTSFYASRTQDKSPNLSDTSPAQTFSIPLSPTSSSSVSVRYWVNSTLLTPNSPVMLTMGGEGTASGVRCNEDMERHGAVCVQVEHRFYGESLPPEGGEGWWGLGVGAPTTPAAKRTLRKSLAPLRSRRRRRCSRAALRENGKRTKLTRPPPENFP